MLNKEDIIIEVVQKANELGLKNITPKVLNDSGNLIVHLTPFAVVARVAIYVSKENPTKAYNMLKRELNVANHLNNKGVSVLKPTVIVNPGPHDLGNVYMTLWNYIPPTDLKLTGKEAVELVTSLSTAMNDFKGDLPVLGVWHRVSKSAENLSKNPDPKIRALVNKFKVVNKEFMSLKPEQLVPSHGDSHKGNLMASPKGWLWTDFEDVSLMPKYWDLASFFANTVLFKGFKHPIFQYLMNEANIVNDVKAFKLALTARVLMSVIGNLDLALQGFGDLEFANMQLELVESFLEQVELLN